MKIITLITFLLIINSPVKSQSAPAASQPGIENKILIDSLMSVSKYDEYFIQFCDRQIDNAAKSNKWTFEQTRTRKLNVNFDEFKKYTIYNWFSTLSSQELSDLINVIGKLNSKNKYSSFLITHSGVQSNLELFVKEYLK